MSGFGQRLQAAFDASGQLCLGIDPHLSLLGQWGLEESAAGAREFGLRAVDAAAHLVPAVKPQIAFFERFGAHGYAALERVIAEARGAGLLVVADVKRGDMGTSFDAYADAWLRPGAPLEADAMTVNLFQGVGIARRAFELGQAHGKGIFGLVATSNPEAASYQTARLEDGRTVSAAILAELEARNADTADAGSPLGPFGVVLGATRRLEEFGLDLGTAPHTPILGPGFGAQGAQLADIRGIYGAAASRVLASVSRDALIAGPGQALRDRLQQLRDELQAAL